MATIKEIAKKAKVAISTVDRVLHNRGEVAPETEAKIKKIIKELKYKPNIFASHLKLGKTFRFAVLIPNPKLEQYSKYWELPIQGIKKAQKELEGQKVEVDFHYYSRSSVKVFQKKGERILQEKYDGLLIAPMFYEAAEKFIKEVPSYLPYIFIGSKIPDSKYLSYLGQDSFQSGVLSGMLMKQLLGTGGMIAIIGIKPWDFHIEERIKGFNSYFGNDPNFTMAEYAFDSTNAESESRELPKKVITENENIRGLFIPGGPAAPFAMYIQDHNLNEKIHIVGYDLVEANRHYLQKGLIKYIISQQPENQGYQGIYSLYRYCVLREKPQKEILLPIDIIAKENVDYY